jgi:LysR family glycine cleavage system transcriptional activator
LFASQRLMPALPKLRLLHPDLLIDVDTGANRIARLNEGIDVAIAIADAVDDKLYSRMLERGRVIAIGSRDLLERIRIPADLEGVHILLHQDMPKAFDAWRNAIGMPELEPAETSHFDAGQLILDAAAGGLGIAFMLDNHLGASTDARLVQFFDKTAESPYAYWFACNHQALERRPVRIFHNWLFEEIAMGKAA